MLDYQVLNETSWSTPEAFATRGTGQAEIDTFQVLVKRNYLFQRLIASDREAGPPRTEVRPPVYPVRPP